MCGILAYLGKRDGVTLVHEGLKALSYRGYDSWGIAAHTQRGIHVHKRTGDISLTVPLALSSSIVLGHTRWATHGGVTEHNAHPHVNTAGDIAVVHNGIIENFAALRDELTSHGYTFLSNTDTEVIPHLLDYYCKQGHSFFDAFKKTLAQLDGSYAILATKHGESDVLFARNASPLLLGLGDNEHFISSDIPSFLHHTKTVVHLEDGDYGKLNGSVEIYQGDSLVNRQPTTVTWDVEVARKGEYPHFMLKEINEQPFTIRKALNQHTALLHQSAHLLHTANTVYMVGCGTSYNACATAAYFFAQQGINTMPALASEFGQHERFIDDKTVVVAVSQSGETADVLDVVKLAKKKNARIVALVNVVSSTLARIADVVIPMNSGPELSVVSTKCFTAQLSILMALARINEATLREAADTALHVLREHKEPMQALAKHLSLARTIFVLGRGTMAPIAREAALKIKEVSYIHAEGMPAGELKHGTLAVIEEGTPVIVFADNTTRALTTSNAMEVKARGAFVIGVDSENCDAYDVHIKIPNMDDATSLLAILPIQLLAYDLAVERGCDPDKPRNLAKSVTVR